MKNPILALLALVLILASCNDKAAENAATSDSATLDVKPVEVKRERAVNNWKARIGQGNTPNDHKLVVTGSVYVQDSAAKPRLSRQKGGAAINLSELVLKLSHQPASTGRLVDVSYLETLSRPDKYQSVKIVYNKKVVVTIPAIEGLKPAKK